MKKEDREKLGKRAATVAIAGNIFLTVFNIAVGIIAGSYALISEGAHTISDIVTSVIAYVGFKIGSKPADDEHPLGHGRAEAIAGLLIGVFLAIIAYEIITGAIDRLFFGGTPAIPEPIAIVMAIIGVIVNFVMSQYIINLGERANSPAIVADGKHQRVDILSSLAILFGILQNFDVFDFSLSDDEMAQIAQLNQHDTGIINFGDPQFVKYLIQNYG